MITVHRLADPHQPLLLNPDQIQTVEAHPDTVVTLANALKFVVAESPADVVERIREWRASVLAHALARAELAGTDAAAAARLLPAARG